MIIDNRGNISTDLYERNFFSREINLSIKSKWRKNMVAKTQARTLFLLFFFLCRFLSFFLFIFFADSYGYNQKNLAGHKLVSWITFLLISLQRRLRRNSFENIRDHLDEPHHINDDTNDFFFRYEITISLEKYCFLKSFLKSLNLKK